jgi:hypothetical protein
LVTDANLNNPSGALAAFSSTLLRGLQSLRGWWSGANSGNGSVRVWVAGQSVKNHSQPGKVVKAIPMAAKVHHASPAMPRAWHSFVARRRSR